VQEYNKTSQSCRFKRKRARQNIIVGFTLIEVLVVVAIIALLVAILVPSLARVRWHAKNVACKSNLHQLGNLYQIYASTHHDFFPITTWGGDDSQLSLWKSRLLKELDILICPATKNIIRPETLIVDGVTVVETSVTSDAGTQVPVLSPRSDIERLADGPEDTRGALSYEYQSMYTDRQGDDRHKKTSNFVLPPYESMLVLDGDDSKNDNPEGCNGSLWGTYGGNNCPQPWDNHGKEGENVMYADGHASWEKKIAGYRKYDSDRVLPENRWVYDENLSIDMVWIKSERPFLIKK